MCVRAHIRIVCVAPEFAWVVEVRRLGKRCVSDTATPIAQSADTKEAEESERVAAPDSWTMTATPTCNDIASRVNSADWRVCGVSGVFGAFMIVRFVVPSPPPHRSH